MERKLVLFALRVPEEVIGDLSKRLGIYYEFRWIDPKQVNLSLVSRAEVIVLASPSERIVSEASSCKWFHTISAGIDDYLSLKGIGDNPSRILTNSAGAYAIQVSEHVFALVLGLTRRIPDIAYNQRLGRWGLSDAKGAPREIYGLSITIVGLGHVGLEIAKRAKSFGLYVIGVKRNSTTQLRIPGYEKYIDEIVAVEGIEQALTRSDIVVNSLPLTRETRGLFDLKMFHLFKKGAIFINVGRGATVIESDLTQALKKGLVISAGLDVFEEEPLPGNSPLWKMENVIVSPHCSGRSENSLLRAVSILEDNLERYVNDQPLRNVVDRTAAY